MCIGVCAAGDEFWDDVIGEVCGSSYPEYGLNTTGRYMFIRMVSDDNGVNGLGFQLQYKSFDLGEYAEGWYESVVFCHGDWMQCETVNLNFCN